MFTVLDKDTISNVEKLSPEVLDAINKKIGRAHV